MESQNEILSLMREFETKLQRKLTSQEINLIVSVIYSQKRKSIHFFNKGFPFP